MAASSTNAEIYKYTKNSNRLIFSERIDNVKYYLLEMLMDIKIDFQFKGKTQILTYGYNREPNIKTELVDVNSVSQKLKIELFGGSVYSLYDRKYPDLNIYQYMDPTGDIDVRLFKPETKLVELEKVDYLIIDVDKNNNLSYLTNSYTYHIYERFVIILREKKINTLHHYSDAIPFDINEITETYIKIYDVVNIGPLLVIRALIDNNLIKIQLVCKLPGMLRPDHIIEFVYPNVVHESEVIDETAFGDSSPISYAPDIIELDDYKYPVQSFNKLFSDNIQALYMRSIILDYADISLKQNSIHKVLNHVQRIIILNNIIPKLKLQKHKMYKYSILRDLHLLILFYIVNFDRLHEFMYFCNDRTPPCKNKDKIVFMNSSFGNFLEIIHSTMEKRQIDNSRGWYRIQTFVENHLHSQLVKRNMSQENIKEYIKNYKVFKNILDEYSRLQVTNINTTNGGSRSSSYRKRKTNKRTKKNKRNKK
jgi:hypothetical protein